MMREFFVSRKNYEIAAAELLKKADFKVSTQKLCKLQAEKNTKKLFMEVVCKNLPYFGVDGKEAFPWETHIKADRINKVERIAKELNAEPWLCFCYCLRNNNYKKHFNFTTRIGEHKFGIKGITTNDYKANMRPRSENSWNMVELNRNDVLTLTNDF